MNTSQVRGITGLLDGILPPARPAIPNSPTASQAKMRRPTRQSLSPSAPPLPAAVRRGRPPGKDTSTSPKEKLTVWITGTLIADYRDWTWEARCQLSHLVERALADYRQSRRRGQ